MFTSPGPRVIIAWQGDGMCDDYLTQNCNVVECGYDGCVKEMPTRVPCIARASIRD